MVLTPREMSMIQIASTPGSVMKQFAYKSGISEECLKSRLHVLSKKLSRHGYKVGSVRDLGLFGLMHCKGALAALAPVVK
jgi:hypothetical protein